MFFPDNYFQDELRCDFMVSEMMKRAWAAELEVLQVVINICHRRHIPYFADSGTLLGAIRHQGFIPWDDDIDIALLREDYNELVRILPSELPPGFVMTGMYSGTEHLQKAGEAQQIRVVADENYWSFSDYMEYFHGFPYFQIGIDIFALDYIPRDSSLASAQLSLIEALLGILTNWDALHASGELVLRIDQIETLCNTPLKRDATIRHQMWRILDSLCALCHEDEADEVTNFPFFISIPSYHMKKEWYSESISVPFENINIAIPKGYHEILSALYGDYMTPVKQPGFHDYPFYQKQEPELQTLLKKSNIDVDITEFCRNWKKYLR